MNIDEFRKILLELNDDEIEQFKELIKDSKKIKKEKEMQDAKDKLKLELPELYSRLEVLESGLSNIVNSDTKDLIYKAFPLLVDFFKKKSTGNSGSGKVKDAVMGILANNMSGTSLSAKEVESELNSEGIEYGKNYVPYLLRRLWLAGEIKRDDNKKYYI